MKIGHEIRVRDQRTNIIVIGRICSTWFDTRTTFSTFGKNVCVEYQLNKLKHTVWVNEKQFGKFFPDEQETKSVDRYDTARKDRIL